MRIGMNFCCVPVRGNALFVHQAVSDLGGQPNAQLLRLGQLHFWIAARLVGVAEGPPLPVSRFSPGRLPLDQRRERGAFGIVLARALCQEALQAEAKTPVVSGEVRALPLKPPPLVSQDTFFLPHPVATEREFRVDIAQGGERLQIALSALLAGLWGKCVALLATP
ncbi:MAG: hypothetical protein NVS2B4_20110 [Ramlibacter sp.]